MGKHLPPMSPEYKIDKYKVKGCQSQVWLYSYLSHDADAHKAKLQLQADSDALIVKGLIAILLQIYSNTPIDEILNYKNTSFLEQMELHEHLSPTRSNGLYAILKQIYYDAQVLHLTKR